MNCKYSRHLQLSPVVCGVERLQNSMNLLKKWHCFFSIQWGGETSKQHKNNFYHLILISSCLKQDKYIYNIFLVELSVPVTVFNYLSFMLIKINLNVVQQLTFVHHQFWRVQENLDFVSILTFMIMFLNVRIQLQKHYLKENISYF